MGSDDALTVVNRFNEAWGAHDLDATLALVTDDCVFDATGPAPDVTEKLNNSNEQSGMPG